MDEVEEGGGKRKEGGRRGGKSDRGGGGSCKEDGSHTHIALYLRAYLVLNKRGGEYSSPSPSPLSLTLA